MSSTGKHRKQSDETKRKIGLSNSIALKGNVPWNKGLKGYNNGHFVSEDTKKKIGDSHRGKHWKIKDTSKMHHKAWNKDTKRISGNKDFGKIRNTGRTRFKKGLIPWNYIDGSSTLRYSNFQEWVKIAKQIYERDNWTCQKCKKKGGLIHAHHIIPYSISKDNSFNNLITLCVSCHAKVHQEMRKVSRFSETKGVSHESNNSV